MEMQNRGMYDEMELETVEKIGGRSGRDCFCGGSGRRLRPRGMGWETLRVHGSLECGQERVCVQRGVV